MRYLQLTILFIGLLFSCNPKEKEQINYLAEEDIFMAAPILECSNLFFTDSVEVKMKFSLPNTSIKYALDGLDVVDTSETYKNPIFLSETTQIEAQNFHSKFQWGSSVILKVVKTNNKLVNSQIEVSPAPNERYQGNGAASLTDHNKGTTSFANDNAWLGFQDESIQIDINFPKAETLSKVTVSSMANHGAWIFLPKTITIYSDKNEVGSTELLLPPKQGKTRLEFIEIPIKENTYKNLKIMVSSVNEIPEWHQGKGTVAWFFVDEILVE